MPWKESRIVDQRLQFLSSYQQKEMSLSDLCREFGVSRPTGYRWINRYKEVGPEGILDRSRKPHWCSHATSEATENAILELRSKHPSWGARKPVPAQLNHVSDGTHAVHLPKRLSD
jgi:transposase